MRQRDKQKNLAITNGATFLGIISGSHEPDNEVVTVQYPGGERKLRSPQPYVGADSWIRVGAESGIPVVMAQRPDSNEPEILAFGSRKESSKVQTDLYKSGFGLYRPLTPGELEVHSKGTAQTFWSRRPILDQRAGLIRNWLDQDALEAGAKSPLHVRQLHLHNSSSMGDEERFGVVQRPIGAMRRIFARSARAPNPILTAKTIASGILAGVIPQPGPWAKEHTRILKSGSLIPPILLDVREGDVMDDFGIPVFSTLSGLPLRFKGEWFCDSPLGGEVFVGIDQMGNVGVALPTEATFGLDLKIALGDFTVSVGKNYANTVMMDYSVATASGKMTFDSALDYKVTTLGGAITMESATDYNLKTVAGAMTIDSALDITATTKTNVAVTCVDMQLKAKTAALIDGADTPMVRGNDLKTWIETVLMIAFNTHVHPTGVGPSGPPVAPLQPPPPTLLSLFAMVK